MKIGLITYHAAYNYGSVLQAYATQCAVETLGHSVEIINYRMKEQRKVYGLYRAKYGWRVFLKDLLQIPVHAKRILRKERFEHFFVTYMKLSPEYTVPKEIIKSWNQYDAVISGSDQIWNKHSLELENNTWEYMQPYLLEGYNGKKISYASSIANMTNEEMDIIINNVRSFDAVSLRENSSVKRVEDLYDLKAVNVLDPTFLLSREEWIKRLHLGCDSQEKYILFYSLEGIHNFRENVRIVNQVAKNKGCKLVVVTPFAYLKIRDDNVNMMPELGPIEFLEMINNAESVITSSYHGTILSINFGKDVYSLCKNSGSEFRKTDILNRLGLSDRIVENTGDLLKKEYKPIEYEQVQEKLWELLNESMEYLSNAIEK